MIDQRSSAAAIPVRSPVAVHGTLLLKDGRHAPSGEKGEAAEPGLVPRLLSISKSTRAFLALLLAEIDLHPGQDQLLCRLEPGQPLSVSTLADQLAVRPSTVSKMLDRLIEKQLVVRAANSQDARRTMVMLTKAGEKAKHAVQVIWSRLESDLETALPPEDHQRLSLALGQIDDLLTAKLRRLR